MGIVNSANVRRDTRRFIEAVASTTAFSANLLGVYDVPILVDVLSDVAEALLSNEESGRPNISPKYTPTAGGNHIILSQSI